MKKILLALLPAIISRVMQARKAKRNGAGTSGGTTRY
ncbi:hypothetical protein M2428_001892 [Arthrobacter sp. ES3-54]|nr:hypothetical protein [Arthrobacter sp. ES3-54]